MASRNRAVAREGSVADLAVVEVADAPRRPSLHLCALSTSRRFHARLASSLALMHPLRRIWED